MRRLIPLLLVALAGCTAARGATDRFVIDTLPSGVVRITSEEPNGWRDSSRAWRVEAAGRYAGAEGTEAALNNPQSLAVDGGGRVYVADQKPTVIKVFGADGRFIRAIGREGEGPGEFRVAFLAAAKDRLVVHDPQTSRTSVFDTSGAFLTSWRSACCYWTAIAIDTAGRIAIPAPNFGPRGADQKASRGTPWIRYRLDGSLVDTLWVPDPPDPGKYWTLRGEKGKNQMVMQMDVPFTPTRHLTPHPWGGFVEGWSGAFEYAVSRTGTDTSRLVRRSWQPEPIPEALRVREVEDRIKGAGDQFDPATLRATFRLDDIPQMAPAYVGLAVDEDGNVWARQLIGSDSTRTAFEVFDARGAWLGRIVVPAAMPSYGALYFGRGELYAGIEDDDGRPVVVRYRLVR